MSLSLSLKFLCFTRVPSMFTDSQPKTGNDSVPFYIDFGSNPKRFGRFTVSPDFKKWTKLFRTIFPSLQKR